MQGCIALSAALGGVGLGTVSAGLALSLSDQGLRVALVDANAFSPSADLFFDFQEKVLYTFSDIVSGVSPERVAFEVKEGLFVFPSSAGMPLEGDLAGAIRAIQRELSPDVLLIETPLSLLPCFSSVISTAVLVSSPEERALRASEAAAESLALLPSVGKYLLLNKTASFKEDLLEEAPLLSIVDRIALPLLGVCPREYERSALSLTGKKQKSSNFKKAMKNVAVRLLGGRVPLLQGLTLDGFNRRHYIERAERAPIDP